MSLRPLFTLSLPLAVSALCLIGAGTVQAKQERLTEEAIKAFYNKAAQVQLEGAQATVDFLEKHAAEDVDITMHIIVNIKGAPQQKQTRHMDKSTLIADTKKGYEIGAVEDVGNEVIKIEIADDGQSAKVKETSYSNTILTQPTPQGTVTLRNIQNMFCDDTIILNAQGVIKSTQSECSVEVEMEPVQ